jgi:hypothetical protein
LYPPALLGEKDGVDVGEHTARARGDGDAGKELVELLVVAAEVAARGELHVAEDDAGLLAVAGSVAGELDDPISFNKRKSISTSSSEDSQANTALLFASATTFLIHPPLYPVSMYPLSSHAVVICQMLFPSMFLFVETV